MLQPSDKEEHIVQYSGARSLRPLIQFVVSQASVEVKSWNWRGERIEMGELGEDEEDEVLENDDHVKQEL